MANFTKSESSQNIMLKRFNDDFNHAVSKYPEKIRLEEMSLIMQEMGMLSKTFKLYKSS